MCPVTHLALVLAPRTRKSNVVKVSQTAKAMQRECLGMMLGGHGPRRILLAAAFVCLACYQPMLLSTAGQKPLSVIREKTGLSISTSVPAEMRLVHGENMTKDEKKLVSHLAEAGRRGHWTSAARLWNKYSGCAIPVFNAAMQAANRCGRHLEAEKIYDRLRNLHAQMVPPPVSPVTLHMGLEIEFALTKSGRRRLMRTWSTR